MTEGDEAEPNPPPDEPEVAEPNPPRRRASPKQGGARYYVWEMGLKQRKTPVRLVNARDGGKAIALPLDAAKKLARIGARYGKHDRAVTTTPKGRGFKVVAQYRGGSGENVTKELYGR
jgi:hypothetical protein